MIEDNNTPLTVRQRLEQEEYARLSPLASEGGGGDAARAGGRVAYADGVSARPRPHYPLRSRSAG